MYKEYTQNRFKSIEHCIMYQSVISVVDSRCTSTKPMEKQHRHRLVKLLKTYLKTDKLYHVIPNQSTTNPYHLLFHTLVLLNLLCILSITKPSRLILSTCSHLELHELLSISMHKLQLNWTKKRTSDISVIYD